MHSLTLLDILVILFVGGGALLGVMRGFVTEVLSLFAWVAALIALKLFYAPATLIIGTWLHTKAGASLLAFALVFAIVFFTGPDGRGADRAADADLDPRPDRPHIGASASARSKG